ncbi:hypothetical protein T484DRAFT_3443463 [Baffinella frigidus]|nr:hypothetical protein T484DRAFT_3443463 [Cryptophyta sp. CCMP2293]
MMLARFSRLSAHPPTHTHLTHRTPLLPETHELLYTGCFTLTPPAAADGADPERLAVGGVARLSHALWRTVLGNPERELFISGCASRRGGRVLLLCRTHPFFFGRTHLLLLLRPRLPPETRNPQSATQNAEREETPAPHTNLKTRGWAFESHPVLSRAHFSGTYSSPPPHVTTRTPQLPMIESRPAFKLIARGLDMTARFCGNSGFFYRSWHETRGNGACLTLRSQRLSVERCPLMLPTLNQCIDAKS